MNHSPKNDNPTRSCTRAFTLVELLVATAVLSVLVVMLAQVMSMVGDAWSGGTGRAERQQNGRALVDFVGRDLRSAALPVDPLSNGLVPDLQFVVNPAAVPAQFRNPQAIFWQAPIATDTSKGNMAEIGYFVRWDESHDPPRAMLCRVFTNPGETQHKVYDTLDWLSQEKLQTLAPVDPVTGYRGLFAENVIGFWARCLDSTGNLISQADSGGQRGAFDSRKDYLDTSYNGEGATINITRKAPVLPSSVEISLLMLDSRAAASITPAIMGTLKSLVITSDNAATCERQIQADPSLRSVMRGMTMQTLKVPLENAP
jgi:prepilin-type N-terminal cleavage/methylation domain-containing protein